MLVVQAPASTAPRHLHFRIVFLPTATTLADAFGRIAQFLDATPAANPGHEPINVALLGLGTVGYGTWTVLNRNERRSPAAPVARSASPGSPEKRSSARASSRAARGGSP